MKTLLTCAFAFLMLTSCRHNPDNRLEIADPGQKSQRGDPNVEVKVDEPTGDIDVKAKGVLSGHNDPADTAKKIIKEGEISFESTDIAITRKRILLTLHKLGGYVYDDSESLNLDENRREYALKTRIPAKSFDLFLDSVASGAKQIDSKNISSKDVTTEFIDISTRLDHKKLLESRYVQLMKQANKMTDILEVESKLNAIRSEIESTQGQLNYLNKQVAFSSLDITFYSKAKPVAVVHNGPGRKFKKALVRGWAWVERLFYDGVSCWPIAAVIVMLVVYFKVRRKRGSAAVVD